MSESGGDNSLKFHTLVSLRVGEAQHICVQAQAMHRVIAVSILNIATNWMSHIGGMDANLILPARLQAVFHERMVCGTVESMEMCYRIFASVIHLR